MSLPLVKESLLLTPFTFSLIFIIIIGLHTLLETHTFGHTAQVGKKNKQNSYHYLFSKVEKQRHVKTKQKFVSGSL